MRQTDKEYAEALFELCAEEGTLSECLADVNDVKELFKAYPEYVSLLSSPAVPLSERLSAIDEAFGERMTPYTVYFLKLLCEKGRICLFSEIAEELNKLYLHYTGRTTAYVTSAFELSDEQKAALVKKLSKSENKEIDAVYSVDPSLMGGVKVEVCGKVYDGTIKRRIRDVKEVMMDEQT